LKPYGISKLVALGAEVGGGAIDRLQEHQQIRLVSWVQRRGNGPSAQGVQLKHLFERLGLAAVQIRRGIVNAEQRRHVEPIHPKRRAGGGVVADLQGIGDIERPHILEIFDLAVVAGEREELIRRRCCHRRRRWCFGPFRLDPDYACVWCGAQAIPLKPKTFAVLQLLVAHAGSLVTKEALFGAVWPDTAVSDAVLRVCIGEIRRVLGDTAKTPEFIATLHRRGYRFIAPVTTIDPSKASGQLPTPHGIDSPSQQPSVFRPIPLLEREVILRRFHEGLAQVRRGIRQVIFITGEAGIGKTAVVEAFVDQAAAEPHLWIACGRCVEQYGTKEAYLPVLEALGQLCREPGHRSLIALLGQQAPTWLVQMPWLLSAADRGVFQQELLGATRERMLRELAEVLETLTAEISLMLVLEDLHWSDYATLDLLALLARRREPARLLVIGTYRPLEVALQAHPLYAVKQDLQLHGHCIELLLASLSDKAVAAYLDQRFPGHHFPCTLAPWLRQHTAGNPLFLVIMVAALVERGVLSERDGYWALQGEPGATHVEIPEGLRQVIEQQIARLPTTAQRILEAASVAGVTIASAVVASCLVEDEIQVEECCEELARHGLFLRLQGMATWPDGTPTTYYAFRHGLYQQVAYQRLGAARRTQLHRRIGIRLEEAYGQRAGELAAELAVHFEQGRETPRAVQFLQRAADNAAHRYAHHEVIVIATRALELLKTLPDSPERIQHELDMQTALGPALIATKGYAASDVELAYLRARQLCQHVGEAAPLFRVLRGLWDCYLVRAELQTAYELAEQLLTLAQRTHEPAFLVEAHRALGTTLLFLGELTSARIHLQQGIALYTPQQHHDLALLHGADPGVICRLYAASALWLLGYADQALRSIDEALTLAQGRCHPFSLAFALSFAAQIHHRRREVELTQKRAEAAIAVSTDYGFPFFVAWGTVLQGWSLAEQGQGEAGIAQIHQGLSTWHAMGAQLTRPHALALLAEAYGREGQAEEGLRALDEALTAVHSTGERWWEAESHRLKGEFLLMQAVGSRGAPVGAPERAPLAVSVGGVIDLWPILADAETWFRQALDIAHRQGEKSLELRAALSLSRLWWHQGKQTDARQMLGEVYDWFAEGFETADLQEAQVLLEELRRASAKEVS
jgi:DNA-binding winged helix-turn-helix (wHTH) protein/predicted ATPase